MSSRYDADHIVATAMVIIGSASTMPFPNILCIALIDKVPQIIGDDAEHGLYTRDTEVMKPVVHKLEHTSLQKTSG